ncbi:hypothetical protein H2N71_28655 [Pseudomonas aeruginosa]|uniref:hypothetical protein n=1 Tax=Pseudomonas aeruginosa TaxID=287 RepID=UPI0015F05CCE|nr:hypothetical protein [Pseudomonas aeruginosa]MBA5076586.1 hypothetical protein [Pseudomonas aeruginosa]MBA5102067.1 hypothetical protein [Pseudomonas aeruginosa]
MDTIAFGVGVRKVSWPDGYEVAEDDVIDLGRGMVTTQAKNVPSSAIKAVFDALHGAEVAFAVKALKAVSSRDYAQAHKDDWDLWEELDMVA